MNLKTFKRLAAQVAELEKSKIEFDVSIKDDNAYIAGSSSAIFEPCHYKIENLQQLSTLQSVLGRPVKLTDHYNTVKITNFTPVNCSISLRDITEYLKKNPNERQFFPVLKFISNSGTDQFYGFDVSVISKEPQQTIENDITYRFVGNSTVCLFCVPHTHAIYNYLDRGFFYCHISKHLEKERVVVANELTVDTYLVMLLTWLHPTYTKQLVNDCFINANQAKLLRVKFEKDLPVKFKQEYELVKTAALKEYEKTANSNLLQRVADGKVPHATYNNIRFTADSAVYETISITAQGLLSTLQSRIAFDDRTDIYSIIRDYTRYIVYQLEEQDLLEERNKLTAPTPTGDAVADKKAMDKYLSDLAAEVTAEYIITINGIEVKAKRTTENTRRYVNDVMINKAEVEEVIFQASCYNNTEDYEKFIKSVSKMSLKWHKALANGIAVKINTTLSDIEYSKAEAPTASPRIKFTKDDKDFKLVLSDTESVRIKFNLCLTKLATLNRMTNNRWNTTGYGKRDTNWAKRELVKILKECCTFDKKEVHWDESYVPALDENNEPLKDKDGNPTLKLVKTKRVVESVECLLTDEKAAFVGKMAEEFQRKALEKSEKFLADAIKNTGAKLITFQGEEGYLVEGKLRKYVVNKRTNQVMNYETKGHICIVEPGHQVSVGGDATACRLYALRNDSVLTQQIGTLRHG